MNGKLQGSRAKFGIESKFQERVYQNLWKKRGFPGGCKNAKKKKNIKKNIPRVHVKKKFQYSQHGNNNFFL